MNILFDLNGVLFEKDPQRPGTLRAIDRGLELLHACAEQHTLFVCSNVQGQYLEQLYTHYADVMDLFTGIVTPAEAGVQKPDRAIFEYVIQTYSIDPSQTVLLDDVQGNIVAAQQVGMKGILVTDFDTVHEHLKALKILAC